ncbi:hypothetical protein [Dyadobacter sp. NIV53]|uniref:hypothetical protein n=1 Tax=Dyadobacter sp. NIV53 TaxID=2861765 RepID=UPI001C88B5A6|nr:hypothetical protein [Dyadobacter sp. NIV53]
MKSLEKGIPEAATNRNKTLKTSSLKTLVAAVILSAGALTGYAQSYQNGYENQQNNNQNNVTQQSLIQAIAPYNEDVRNDILIATKYPDVLQKL